MDNYSNVYYTETEDGYRYLWLVQFSDGSYGWQEVDENGNLIFPNRGTEEAPSEEASPAGEAEESSPDSSENVETEPASE